MNAINIIGIDSDLSGACAILGITGLRETEVWDISSLNVTSNKREYNVPSMVAFLERFKDHNTHVGLELVHPFPGVSRAAAFSMGKGTGIWLGIFHTLRLPYTLILPNTWKKEMLAGLPKGKESSRLRAQQLFPNIPLPLKEDHGKAEALLIAEFLRRQLQLNETQ